MKPLSIAFLVLLGLTAATAEAGEPVPCPSIGAPQDGGYVYDPDNICDDEGNLRRTDDSTPRQVSIESTSAPVQSTSIQTPEPVATATPAPCWSDSDVNVDGRVSRDEVFGAIVAFLDHRLERDQVLCAIQRYLEDVQ